ncbi:MAG: ABC transporter ATP-binding protein, partial [Eubacterium sp.]|nr:ABC transporter ATP-binding protein [Eubacterium sp.]
IDTETENLIKEALDVILKDKTAFMVAHRLSTIRNADRILYIDNKGIAEEGTHDELMKRKGLYYQLN